MLGRNGSGKSTLLRIMAGKDKNFDGEARLTDGFTVGLLEQEPQLNPDKDVFGNVEEAVAPTRALLTEFEQLSEKLGEVTDPDEMEKLLERQAKVQDKIEAVNAWELDRQVEIAMSAMNLPPGDADVKNLSGGEKRRVALCKILLEQPDLLLLDEPTNHLDAESVAWLERHLEEYPGTVVAVTHDRYFLDNAAKWILELDRGQGHPFEGNYSSWLEQKKKRLEVEEKQATARQTHAGSRAGVGPHGPARRQAKSKARTQGLRNHGRRGSLRTSPDELEIQIPPGPRLGDMVVEAVNLGKSYGDRVIFENVNFRLPAGRHRRHHRPQRRRQNDAAAHAHGPGGAGRRRAENRPHGRTWLRRPKPRRPRGRSYRVRGNLRRSRHARDGRPQDELAGLRLAVQLHRP